MFKNYWVIRGTILSFFEGLAKFIIGGSLVLFVSIISKGSNKYIAGVIVLFPAITSISYLFMKDIPSLELKKMIITSIFAVPTTIVFLLCLWFFIDKMNIWLSIPLSLIGWLASAFVYVLIKQKFGF